MNFERKVVETLKDDLGNEIRKGDYVVYKTKSKPNVSIIAQYCGMGKGYLIFSAMGSNFEEDYYTVLPKTIGYFYKCNVGDEFFIFN